MKQIFWNLKYTHTHSTHKNNIKITSSFSFKNKFIVNNTSTHLFAIRLRMNISLLSSDYTTCNVILINIRSHVINFKKYARISARPCRWVKSSRTRSAVINRRHYRSSQNQQTKLFRTSNKPCPLIKTEEKRIRS